MLCENGSKTLHRYVDSMDYEGRIASALFHEMPRITPAMAESNFYMFDALSSNNGGQRIQQTQSDDDGLRLVLILLCLLLITLVFIIIILYWRYTITSSQSKAPQIILGDFLESREAYVYSPVYFKQVKTRHCALPLLK